jgi:hypothetical protein
VLKVDCTPVDMAGDDLLLSRAEDPSQTDGAIKGMRNSHDQLHVGGKICNGVAAFLAITCLSFIHSNASAQSAESRVVLRQPGAGAVSLDRLRKVDQEPGQWMTSGRDQSAAFFRR